MSKIIDSAIATTGIYETTDPRDNVAVEAELRADDRCEGGGWSLGGGESRIDAWGKREDGSEWHARILCSR